MGLCFHWWPTKPSVDTYAPRDKSCRVLVSSYCCSTYRVADPFSSLGTYSSIAGPVIHPIAYCEHPLLGLLGPSIISQDTALSWSFQQNIARVCNGVSVWKLIMGHSNTHCHGSLVCLRASGLWSTINTRPSLRRFLLQPSSLLILCSWVRFYSIGSSSWFSIS
jgi:hypothetical protein